MELRQLEAFVAVATELHFGRAAARLQMAQPTLSELIQRLEREFGTPLLFRTTRRVELTAAGTELLTRSKTILDEMADARIAVQRIAAGEAGTVRIGVTPPAAPTLAAHLCQAFTQEAPFVELSVQRMWLPTLLRGVTSGTIDVGLTCGRVGEMPGVTSVTFCAEPLQVGLRAEHPLAGESEVAVGDLAGDVLGLPASDLFPAWALAATQALTDLGISPPSVDLADNDVAATRWHEQSDVDWILLIGSLSAGHRATVVRPVVPSYDVPFTLHWTPDRARSSAVSRFVQLALRHSPPPGWNTAPGHHQHPLMDQDAHIHPVPGGHKSE